MADILFVDDEENLRFLFGKFFENKGHAIDTAEDFKQAMILLSQKKYDVIVTDITMPGKSGIDLLRDIKKFSSDAFVILITGNPSIDSATEAVRHGAFDYLIKPFNMAILEHVVLDALKHKGLTDEKKRLALIEHRYVEDLENTLKEQTHEIRKAYKFLETAHSKSLEILARAADYRDDDTGTHIIKIGQYARIIAQNLGLPKEEVDIIAHAAPMHDVGKIGIPDRILQKPGRLTPEEFEIIKTHTIIGAQIFFGSAHPYHIASGIIALTHHERWEGSGYPRGLKGDEIHQLGRIVAIVDVFDALTTPRVYKEAWTEEKAIELIASEKGKHFDPQVTDCFLDSINEIRSTRVQITPDKENLGLNFTEILKHYDTPFS